jgi:hypothetical protein
LALQFGCTVRELSDKLSVSELQEWIAYYSIDPFGSFRTDLNSAMVCKMLCSSKDAGIYDFMPFEEKQKPSQEDLSKQAYFQGMAESK